MTRPRERYQLDELPGILLFMALGLAWFAWRRMREARTALQRQVASEAELTAALEENRRLERANDAGSRKTNARVWRGNCTMNWGNI